VRLRHTAAAVGLTGALRELLAGRDRRFAGLVDGDVVRPLQGVAELGEATPSELLAEPPVGDEEIPLADVRLRPVVPRPGKIVCMGLNYRAHVDEGVYDPPDYPVLFTKFAETLVAAGDPIVVPPESSAPDYEAELAFVIGRRVRRVSGPAALDAVAGYTIANDVTMRDYQYRTHQWLPGKNWASSTPLGPFLVTPDEVGDPHALGISLELNGEQMQSGNTRQFIFDIPALIAAISEFVPLAPGDVVLTGTPSGVGYRREPKVLLQDGDRVVVEIERVGRLGNPVVAERA
jgi:acylpyruvate hydrolase